MPTTGGALAFAGLMPPYDATVTKNLRDAGAIIIAKTQLTELANWVTVGMPANYNSLNGYGMNPYDPRRDPRDGSPTGAGADDRRLEFRRRHVRQLLGRKRRHRNVRVNPQPRQSEHAGGDQADSGRVSRYGIIPSRPTRTPPGRWRARSPMQQSCLARSKEPRPIPTICDVHVRAPPGRDYTPFLDRNALKGARIGVPRAFFYDAVTSRRLVEPARWVDDGAEAGDGGCDCRVEGAGRDVVDPADIPSIVDWDPARNFLDWPVCFRTGQRKGEGRRTARRPISTG
jgi:amidase